jgi:hypothetical protein
MAKKRRKYSRGSGEEVRREVRRYKRGRAKSGRPTACATRIAVSGPFSGLTPPRNAKYPCGRSESFSRSGGSPWGMVAT